MQSSTKYTKKLCDYIKKYLFFMKNHFRLKTNNYAKKIDTPDKTNYSCL